jgi:hypothetical protein
MKQMPHDTLCSHDVITSITKLLSEAQGLGFNFQPKAMRVDFKDDRKQKIEEYFQKPKQRVEVEESKQAPEEALKKQASWQEEVEDENMMQSAIVLRRGRCGRLFAKYVQRSIFEDSDEATSDLEDDYASERKGLKKRRRRYQDLQEYLRLDGSSVAGVENQIFKGLLLRDQKYLSKNMHRLA